MFASGNAKSYTATAPMEPSSQKLDLLQSPIGKIIRQRRAIKYFSSDTDVPDELLAQIISLSSLAPSAFNLQHWKVFHISDSHLRQQIAAHSYHQPQLYDAPVILAIVMDSQAWNQPLHATHDTNDAVKQQKAAAHLTALYQHRPQLARDEALRSSAMFSMLVMLSAEAAGFNSCPLTGCDFSAIADSLQLTEGQELCMLIALGKAAPENAPRPRLRNIPEQFFTRL